MKDGLYKVQFQVPGDIGFGVAYVRDGKLWGGDSGFYFVGTFTEQGGQITASVKSERHSPTHNSQSLFGRDRVDIQLTGRDAGNMVIFTGTARQVPGVTLEVAMSFITA